MMMALKLKNNFRNEFLGLKNMEKEVSHKALLQTGAKI